MVTDVHEEVQEDDKPTFEPRSSHWLCQIFFSIQRRQFEQVKEAVPMILNVLKAVSLESDEADLEGVFDRAVQIANSICEVCNKRVLQRRSSEIFLVYMSCSAW
ncbi:aberrant root formation protein 4-like [Gastrolobium bilobum]|uniref:aberrant root formation protein 4-like n=1 Tax=Gastrolobium bilobum TaxID=150636 RepID=UPI002AB30675|nr:aberrant root formation protein 4-like [Gastrolobium bilobum]XP_061366323.1 aberrant root formation protein 4-like [Gastrolobium bilobum]